MNHSTVGESQAVSYFQHIYNIFKEETFPFASEH